VFALKPGIERSTRGPDSRYTDIRTSTVPEPAQGAPAGATDDVRRLQAEHHRAALGHGERAAEAMLDLLPEHVNRFRISDHVITYCNAAWASLYGTTPDRAVGTSLDAYLSSDELDGLRAQLSLLGPDRPIMTDVVPREAHGEVTTRWIEWADRYLHCDREPEVLSVGRDVTSRHVAEMELIVSEARFRDLADGSSDIVWRISVGPVRFDYLSPSVERILGYTPAALIEDFGLIDRITDGEVVELVSAALQGGVVSPRVDLRFRHANGSTVVGETSITRVPHGVQGVTRDVTELRRLQAATAELAVRDPLTGLGNRRCFDAFLAAELARTERAGTPLAVAFLDLDGLKRVNDELGHGAGDLVLKESARRLGRIVGDAGRVSRLGGDEFAVVYEPALASSADLIGRLDEALGEPITIAPDLAVGCGASIGEADTRAVGRRSEALLSAADEAMYAVKRSRRSVLRRAP
jgi:diguanylate cyclase (GGDEF)-like protein/PAS domain S-box-containing protein